MNPKLKNVILILLLAAIVFVVIKYKTDPYRVLGEKQFKGLDKPYLKARAGAVSKRNETFTVAGKMYATETGKAI